jgi:hypothetical protein
MPVLTSLASTSIGDRAVYASPNAVRTLVAPGPLVSRAAAVLPVARNRPSAA